MAITNYSELQASIASWLHRDDLTALIPDFITLAEARMNGDLDSRSMEVRTSLTTTADGTLASRLVTLPTDMLEMRRLMITSTDPAQLLEYKTPDQLVSDNLFLTSTSIPQCFTVIDGSIELSPMPDGVYTLELIYRQRLPALSISNTSNWALTANPALYLFGALLESTPYTQDEARVPLFERAYQQAVQSINSIDWYSGSTPRVRSR